MKRKSLGTRTRVRLETLECRLAPSVAPTDEPGSAKRAAPELTFYQPPTHTLVANDGFLTAPASGDPRDIAIDYLRANAKQLGLSTLDLDQPLVTDQYTDAGTGVTHLYLRQTYQGIDVVNSTLAVNVSARGEIINVNSRFLAIDATPAQRGANSAPFVSSSTAVTALAALAPPLGLKLTQTPALVAAPLAPYSGITATVQISAPELSADLVPARQVYVARPDGKLTLAWEYVLRAADGSYWYDVSADAITGALVLGNNWADTDASYDVFAFPSAGPDGGPRTVDTDPPDPKTSPFGWHDTDGVTGAEFTDTRGNNVLAQEDADNNNSGGARPDGGAALDFTAPIDFNQDPTTYTAAATINLFYWNNIIHDLQARYGFDEAAGNFQVTNYSGEGAGGDAVQADSQDGSGTNNANFSTPPDGVRPRMQMFIWTPSGVHTLTVNTGSGLPASFANGVAAFGPTSFNVTANVVQAQPALADTALTNAAAIAGNIALIDRGSNSYVAKVLNAQAAGAVGVIIANNVAGAGAMGMGGTDPSITIPVLSVSLEDGNLMKAALGVGPVNLTMARAATPRRDSSFDAGVIAHEYGHGVSNRLTGGPANSNAITTAQSRGMGEGWGDFYGLMFTQLPGDQANDPIGIGTYLTADPRNGAGIRRQRYSFDMTVDPITFQAYNVDAAHEVHNTGEIWASTLWDLNWILIGKYGYDADLSTGYTGKGAGAAGNKLALQLVNDGLKLQATNPSFIDARDAILLADRIRTGGANQAEIWQAFARRGLGFGASTASSSSTSVTLSFALPTDAPLVATAKTAVVPGQTINIAFDREMDRKSFTLNDIVAFTDTSAANHRADITGFSWADGDRTLRLTVKSSLPVGVYTLKLGPAIASATGQLLNQDQDATPGEDPDDIATINVTAFNSLTVTTATDKAGAFDAANLSLREAIALASQHPGADTITIAADVNGPIVLNPGLGSLQFRDTSGAVTIAGPNTGLMKIDGNNATRLVTVVDQSDVTFQRFELTRGRSTSGAGIFSDGAVTLVDCLVSANNSTGDDGGGAQSRGRLTLVNTTFQNNIGTGLVNYGIFSATNSTFVGNSSITTGGAIYSSVASVTLTNCTFVGNIADSDNTGDGTGGAIYNSDYRSVLSLNNTIVAGNYRFSAAFPNDIILASGAAAVTADSFNNLIGVGGAGGLLNGTNGNQVNVANAMLGTLAVNRGLTPTMALLAGSPAVDAGRNASLPAGVSTDQRGFTRNANGTVDIGAFEEQSAGIIKAVLSKAGVLTLTGDAAGNGVTIKLNEVGVGTTLGGLGTTKITFNGATQTAATIPGTVTSLVAKLGAGSDTLAIDGTADFALTGNAKLNLGAGDNTLNLVTTGKLSVGGSMNVIAATGSDAIAIQGNATSAFAKGALLSLGNGGSSVSIDSLAVHGKNGLTVTAGKLDDTITLKGVTVDQGPAKLTGAAGNLTVSLLPNGVAVPTTVNGLLRAVSAGSTIVNSTGTSAGSLKVQGGKGGVVRLNVTTPMQVAGSASITAGPKADAKLVLSANLNVSGALDVKAGNAASATLGSSGLTVTGPLTIRGTSAKVASVAGAALSVQSLALTGKTVAAIDLKNTTISSLLNLGISSGKDAAFDVNQGSLTVGGDLTLSAKNKAHANIAPTGVGTAWVKGSMLVTGGALADDLTATAGLKVDGDVTLKLKGGDNQVKLGTAGQTLNVGGALNIITVAGADSNTLTGVKVAGDTQFNLGAGVDVVTILDGAEFTGATLIDLGTGDDQIFIANSFGATTGVTFTGLSNFKTGTGNDTAQFGLNTGGPQTTVTFGVAGNVLDLGTGPNTFNALSSLVAGPAAALEVFQDGVLLTTLP